MANYRYKNKVTDDLVDAIEIVQGVGRMIRDNKTDINSVMDNLSRALRKIQSAKEYVDRE